MVNKRPWSGPVGSRREVLRLEWPPRQLNEGGRKLNVKIKRLHPDAVVPKYATELAAGFDLVAVEDVIIAPGETAKIPLGLAFELPPGYVMYVMMRSGIALKTKLRQSNGIGVIDADYRGEVAMIFDNTADRNLGANYYEHIDGARTPTRIVKLSDSRWGDYEESEKVPFHTYLIRKGDRVCQAVIQRYDPVTFTEVDELGATERGSGGFGHSGVN